MTDTYSSARARLSKDTIMQPTEPLPDIYQFAFIRLNKCPRAR